MTLKQIAGLGRELAAFLGLFADCFGRREGRQLLRVYIQGQLSDLHRKTAEAIALRFGKAPRTLQRFLEWIQWNEEECHDRCQQMVAREHAHPEAIGVVDESGVAKSGDDTVGVSRQWNGNRGKVDNCVVGVHLSYAAPGFQCLLGSRLTVEQVRSPVNTWLAAADLTPAKQQARYETELDRQRYHQGRNEQSRCSHTKTRLAKLQAMGIDPNKLRSCVAWGRRSRPTTFADQDLPP